MKLYTYTSAFCPPRILKESLPRYRETAVLPSEHWILDQHYPLDRDQNILELKYLCELNRVKMLDSKFDRGLHRGFNYWMAHVDFKDEDIIIGYDPDSWPIQPGWDAALVDVLTFDPKIAVVGLSSYVTFGTEGVQWEDRMTGGTEYRIALNRPAQVNIVAWRGSFLRSTGGLSQARNYYGHLESAMWGEMQRRGLQKAYLPGFTEDFRLCNLHDREYLDWKRIHAHTDKFPGSFADYIKAGCPQL